MNVVNLIGTVTRASVDQSDRLASVTIAVPRPSKRAGGSGADFIDVQFGGKHLDVGRSLERGDQIGVTGRLRVNGAFTSVSVHDVWKLTP